MTGHVAVPSAQDVADAAVDWFEWHAAHPIDGGPFDVRDDRLYHIVAAYRAQRYGPQPETTRIVR